MHCGGGPTLPGLGTVKVEHLCADPSRCDARGDKAVATLQGGGATPIFLAEKQGPEHYLGKVAPERNARSVLKTCGGDVVRDDWFESGQTVRVVELTSDGKRSLREALKAHLAQELLAHPALLAGNEAKLESIVDGAATGASLQKVSMVSQTYWLSDAAFERRVAQCGEEEQENIVYSLTLLSLSELSRKELEAKLYAGLSAKLAYAGPAPEAAPAPAAVHDPEATPAAEAPLEAAVAPLDPMVAHKLALQERAFATVRALANELRMIAAFGYDEK